MQLCNKVDVQSNQLLDYVCSIYKFILCDNMYTVVFCYSVLCFIPDYMLIVRPVQTRLISISRGSAPLNQFNSAHFLHVRSL